MHASRFRVFNRGANIHCIAAQPVEPGDNKHVAGFHLIEEPGESLALFRGNAFLHRFNDGPRFHNQEPGRDNLLRLVVCGLVE